LTTPRSAGLLMYRLTPEGPQVLLAHPGGPYWARKDDGAWTLPKGEHNEGEEALAAAVREFREETSLVPTGPYLPLGELRLKSGKRIQAWAFRGDCDPAQLRSNSFEMEWPPRSGRMQSFPEIDRAGWFSLAQARCKLIAAQVGFVDRLEQLLGAAPR
jgi:predicted NUDIX family NTP pyrophosphohydrolase